MPQDRVYDDIYEDDENGTVYDLDDEDDAEDDGETDGDADGPPWTVEGWRPPVPMRELIGSACSWPVSRDRQRVDLPDFIRPDYPFDLPPNRLPFAQFVFTQAGAPKFCANRACRRADRCQGGDGPPCFRVDRRDLRQVGLWFMMVIDMIDEPQYWRSLKAKKNRYATFAPKPLPAPMSKRGRR